MSMDIYIYICIYTDDDWWRWEYNYDVDGLSNVGDGVRVVGVIPIWRGWMGIVNYAHFDNDIYGWMNNDVLWEGN